MEVLREEGAIGFYHALNALVPAGGPKRQKARTVRPSTRRAAGQPVQPRRCSRIPRLRLAWPRRSPWSGAGPSRGARAVRQPVAATRPCTVVCGNTRQRADRAGRSRSSWRTVESAALDAQRADNQQLFFLRAARGKLHIAAREHEAALTVFETIGAVSEDGGSTNPNWLPWRSWAAIALHHLGRREEAVARVARRARARPAVGSTSGPSVSLRTLGLVKVGETVGQLGEAVDVLARLLPVSSTPERWSIMARPFERRNGAARPRELRSGRAQHRLGAVRSRSSSGRPGNSRRSAPDLASSSRPGLSH